MKQNDGGKDKLLSIFMLVVFFVGMIGLVVFSKREPLAAVVSVGAIFLTFGLVAACSQKMTFKRLPVLLFPLVGAGMVVIPGLMLYEKYHPGSISIDLEWLGILLLLVLFLIVGFGLFIAGLRRLTAGLLSCTEVVTAYCVDIDVRRSSKSGNLMYSPKWEYDYYGQIYTVQSAGYSSIQRVKIGDTKELKINPQNPQQSSEDFGVPVIILLIMGLLFIGISLLALRHFLF